MTFFLRKYIAKYWKILENIGKSPWKGLFECVLSVEGCNYNCIQIEIEFLLWFRLIIEQRYQN